MIDLRVLFFALDLLVGFEGDHYFPEVASYVDIVHAGQTLQVLRK